jgi:hypothetical protein
LVRELGSDLALERLLLNVRLAAAREANVAAEIVLAYGWGKPSQAVELTGKDGGPVEVSDARERITARLAALVSTVGGGQGPGGDER